LIGAYFILGASIASWKFLVKDKEVSLRDMLPSGVGMYFCFLGLTVYYIFGALFIDRDGIPNWEHGQALVWVIYFLIFIIFAMNLLYARYRDEKSDNDLPYSAIGEGQEAVKLEFSWPLFIALCLVFVGISMGFSFLQPWPQIFIFATLVAGLVLGSSIFLLSLKHAYQGAQLLIYEKPWKDLE